MRQVWIFPGQGSQVVGMGMALAGSRPAARQALARADAALGEPLSRCIAEGPDERLTRTENSQPALLAVEIATVRAWEASGGSRPLAAAGHSLGEYAALVAAGSLPFEDALRLVRLRGRAMQEAVPEGCGAMAAVVGLPRDRVVALCREAAAGEVVEPAAFNAPTQIVVAGHVGAVERLADAAREAGARMVRRLRVSAPFHCSLLQPAAERLREALAGVPLRLPGFPVPSNVTARPAATVDELRERLVEQVVRPVDWVGCVRFLLDRGAEQALEFGPGRTLAGLVRRIERRLRVVSVEERLLAGVAEPVP